MPTVTGSVVAINMGDPFNWGAFYYSLIQAGGTSTTWSTLDPSVNQRWTFTGTGFGSYTNNLPQVGNITAINYTQNGVSLISITGLSLPVQVFYNYIATDNLPGLLNTIFAGADTISGSSGFDNLFGYGGNDTITGGPGGDALNGMDGNDTLNAGQDWDFLYGEDGDDLLNGNGGNDEMWGGAGTDTLNGGAGGDTMRGEGGNDTLNGGDDSDTMYTGSGVDQVDGGAGDDWVHLDRSAIAVGLTIDTGAMATNTGVALADGSTIRNVERFHLITGSGDDTFNVTAMPTHIYGASIINGGAGFDTLTADFSAATVSVGLHLTWSNIESVSMIAGSGEDTLTGGSGNDMLYGNGGNDVVSGGAGGVDLLDGGSGNDRAVLGMLGVTADVTFGLDQFHTASGYTFANGSTIRNAEEVWITTGSGNDTLNLGTGFTGQHRFDGGGGVDTVTGDFSASSQVVTITDYGLLSHNGATLLITAERLLITGTNGDDQLFGSATFIGNDVFYGGAGQDQLAGFAGNDQLYGGAGDDIIFMHSGADIIDGGADFDTLNYRLTYEQMSQNQILDISAFVGMHTALGATLANGAVVRNMEALNAVLGNGDDTIIIDSGETGTMFVDAGDGIDTLQADFSGDTRNISISNGALGFNFEPADFRFTGIERLNVILGDAMDLVSGQDADDIIYGRGGNDFMQGGLGADLIEGGDGDDTLGGYDVNATSPEGDGADILRGGAGDDLLNGGAGGDTLDGGDGVDTVRYASFQVGVTASLVSNAANAGGAAGDIFISIENLHGSNFADTLIGNSGDNLLLGLNGNDTLTGGAGDDYLSGGGGIDVLDGGDGDDFVEWDLADGYSNAQGGAGHDVLVFRDGPAPTSFNLTANGFEAAQVRWLDNSQVEPWLWHTYHYDVQWRLDRESLEADDGALTVLDYDELSAEAWSLKWTHFDTLGRVDLEVLTYDDGSRANLDYDQANANVWTAMWSSYDASDNLLAEAIDYDDGSRITLAHDTIDAFDWSENWVSYDALDRVDAEAIDYDDGSRITQNYDQANAFNWATDWVRYDALDRVDVQVITYDDGTYAVQDFDQNDDHAWASQWWLYDSNDNLIAFQGVNDDGSPFGG